VSVHNNNKVKTITTLVLFQL